MRVAAGAFTNLSRDHLDYHPTLEDYLAAKLRLFDDLIGRGGAAVVYADHEQADAVVGGGAAARAAPPHRRRGAATASALIETAIDGFAQALEVEHAGKRPSTSGCRCVGAFQVENALVAAGLAIATGGEPARSFAALAQLKGAKGRLELVGERNGAPVFVDYAHKPDALDKALEALRPYVNRQPRRGVRLRRRPRRAASGR